MWQHGSLGTDTPVGTRGYFVTGGNTQARLSPGLSPLWEFLGHLTGVEPAPSARRPTFISDELQMTCFLYVRP